MRSISAIATSLNCQPVLPDSGTLRLQNACVNFVANLHHFRNSEGSDQAQHREDGALLILAKAINYIH